MENASDMMTWSVNMTGLSANTYNYTVWTQNTTQNETGDWSQSAMRFVTVSAISACQNLTAGNVIYALIQNVNSSGTCFNILANNITIDGAGYAVNYSRSATGYGVNNTGYNLTTIKNLSIIQGNSSGLLAGSYAIYFSGTANGSITNNIIQTSGTNAYGMSLQTVNSTTVSNNNISISGDSVYGVQMTSGGSNTLSSNNITAASGTSGSGVTFSSSNFNTINNNDIKASGGGTGVDISASNSNTFSGNNVTASGGSKGIRVYISESNTFSGGSITAPASAAYYIEVANSTNTFRNTNFTSARNISFYDAASFFSYNNESSDGIWLRTNVSAITNLTRALSRMSNNLVLWNDTNSTAGVIANYNITGLSANTVYYIYNTSTGDRSSFNRTSDSGGGINFTIALRGNTEIAVEVPPSITVITPTNGNYYNITTISALVLNITTNEPAAWCGFSLNGTANMTMDNTSQTAWNYTNNALGFSEGLNNITFFCNDSRGNIGNVTKYLTKDTAAPTVTKPTHSTPTSSGSTITWNVSESAVNTVYYKTGSDAYAPYSSSTTNGNTAVSITLSGLTASKLYYVYVTSCDFAENCQNSSVPGDEFNTASSGTTTNDEDSGSTGGSNLGGGDTSSGLVKSWSSISAGSAAVMPVSSSSVDVTEIIFKATQALSKAKITVAKLSSRPSSTSVISSGSVYQYISITPENITNDKITSATISFRVNSTWISSNLINSSTITLYRYSSSQWTAIPTHYISTSGGFATYLAETPGFSYFAIVGDPKSAPKPVTVPPVVPPTSYNITNQSNPSSNASFNITAQNNTSTSIEETVSGSTSSLIFIIIVVIVIISALVYYNKKPKLGTSTSFSKKPAYTFKQSLENKGGSDLVYKAPPKEEKMKYSYKPKK